MKEDHGSCKMAANGCIISCLGTILCLASVGLAFGYSYPAHPKRVMPTESMNMHSEMISKSERWEQPSAQKLGLNDANPTKGTEQMTREAEFLDRVDKMQFFKGRQTSHKRSWPIPQLQCKDGCDSYEPSMVQCTNAKSPDQEVAKWRCEADLPRHLKFQKTTINCEGFESIEDSRILRGSCGLEYSLTNSGLKQIPGRVHRHYYTVANEDYQDENMNTGTMTHSTWKLVKQMGGWTASWLVVIVVIIYLIKHNWNSFKTPVSEHEGLRAKVATAHRAWKKETKLAQPTQSN